MARNRKFPQPRFSRDAPYLSQPEEAGIKPLWTVDSLARYKGKYYTLADSAWDRAAFNVLLILFQVTVSDVSQVGIPITISK